MLDKDPSWLSLIPFMLHTGQTQRISLQRVAEAIIIAGITAGAVMYTVQQVLVERLEWVRSDMQTVKQDIKDVDRKVERLRADLYKPNIKP